MITKEKFMSDLEKVYSHSQKQRDELNSYFNCIKNNDSSKLEFVDKFLSSINFEINDSNRNAAIRRLVLLKEDHIVQIVKSKELGEAATEEIIEAGYKWASTFHMKMFDELIGYVLDQGLLTPFYREILLGVYDVGESFTKWDVSWTRTIKKSNKDFLSEFDNDSEKAISKIHELNLIDTFPNGDRGDRCYSVLIKEGNEFSTESYGDFFTEEVSEISKKLDLFISKLDNLEDEVFNQKEFYIRYLSNLKLALLESDTSMLISRWRDVETAWMDITAPLQIGHPIEYYEDHLRNCVSLEWDLRVVNPKRNDATEIFNNVSSMYEDLIAVESNNTKYPVTYEVSKSNLNKVQLYIGKPLFYFGSTFSGLFSAQVVPNDEEVSKKFGKKIFAFSDMILQTKLATPSTKLHKEVFGEEFLTKLKSIGKENPELWHELYSIMTVGHEYGHILWKGEETEVLMNKSGNFKNIEEFKATTGGLVAYFLKSDNKEWEGILLDHIDRSVRLIEWMEVNEVQPYYCEGLVHLKALFEIGILNFSSNKLSIDLSEDKYSLLKNWYIKVYSDLGSNHFLPMQDANEFLYKFAIKEDGKFLPKDEKVYEFVKWYWERYQKIGRELE